MKCIRPDNFSVVNLVDAVVINNLLQHGFDVTMDGEENIYIEGKYYTKGQDLTKEVEDDNIQ